MSVGRGRTRRGAREDEVAPEVRRALSGAGGGGVGNAALARLLPPAAAREIEAGRGGGAPLPEATRAGMESEFGVDFSGVRVHTGARAASLARSLRAEAFTTGSDVYFAHGLPAGDRHGRQLLAHELTHVVQGSAGQSGAARGLSRDSDASEVEARQVAAALGGVGSNGAVERLIGRLGAADGGVVHRAPLTADDHTALAEQLHEAMSGWGTDEEAIFVALQHLGRDPANIAALERAYKAKYGDDLEAEIRDEMSGSELSLALELIGVSPGGAPAPAPAGKPATPAEFETAAKALESAMSGWGTDEEAIYRVLIAFQRDATALATLKTTYQTLFSRALADDLASEMSSDELAYALYLLNAPPTATPATTTTVHAQGTQVLGLPLAGGEVKAHLGADYAAGMRWSDGFAIGYKGGLANESRWLQFIWREIVVTHPTLGEYRIDDPIRTTAHHAYRFSDDPDAPVYNTDSADPRMPFYEATATANRTADATTIYDMPSSAMAFVNAQFARGATQVVSRAHFNTYLIRDYRTLAHVGIDVEWTFTSPAQPPRVQTLRAGGKVDALPEAMRDRLVEQYPDFAYIQ